MDALPIGQFWTPAPLYVADGAVRIDAQQNPAGAEYVQTMRAGKLTLLRAVFAKLETTEVTQTRRITVVLRTKERNFYLATLEPTAITARKQINVTIMGSLAPGAPTTGPGVALFPVPLLVLEGGAELLLQDNTEAAGDHWSNITSYLEEFDPVPVSEEFARRRRHESRRAPHR